MRRRQKLQENGRVDGQIPADTKGPKTRKNTNRREIRRPGRDETPDGREAQREIKGHLAAKEIAAKAPEHGAGQEANVLRQRQQRFALGQEFVGDGCEDERRDDGPEVIAGPAEADDSKEFPLISSHADILNL